MNYIVNVKTYDSCHKEVENKRIATTCLTSAIKLATKIRCEKKEEIINYRDLEKAVIEIEIGETGEIKSSRKVIKYHSTATIDGGLSSLDGESMTITSAKNKIAQFKREVERMSDVHSVEYEIWTVETQESCQPLYLYKKEGKICKRIY